MVTRAPLQQVVDATLDLIRPVLHQGLTGDQAHWAEQVYRDHVLPLRLADTADPDPEITLRRIRAVADYITRQFAGLLPEEKLRVLARIDLGARLEPLSTRALELALARTKHPKRAEPCDEAILLLSRLEELGREFAEKCPDDSSLRMELSEAVLDASYAAKPGEFLSFRLTRLIGVRSGGGGKKTWSLRNFIAARSGSALVFRLVSAFLVFGAITALSLLMPRSLPGELAAEDMTPHHQILCTTCPPTEQLTGIGMLAGGSIRFVNVRFAARPLNSHVSLAFDGVPGAVELQRTGNGWQYSGNPAGVIPALSSAAERGNLVVFGFPATIRTTGIAAATGAGDRIPESGFANSVHPSPVHFNLTDVVLLLILLVTAVYGFRRGALSELGDLVSIVVSFAIAAAVFRPVAAIITSATGYAEGAAAMASGITVLVCATAAFLVIPRLVRRMAPATAGLNPVASRTLGSGLACIRQIPMLAMILTIGTELAVLHWATASITSSVFGSALLNGSKALFTAG